jgi:hypothetical protein
MFLKKAQKFGAVLNIARHHPVGLQRPVIAAARAEDGPAVLPAKVKESVIASYTCDSRNQEGQTRREEGMIDA